jgi:nicotinamide riboside kinase
MAHPLRIVITGAESSGKSTLTRQLGERLGLPYALEYARVYLEENGPDYDYNSLRELSGRHVAYQKQKVSPEEPVGLLDTDLINYKIWAEEVFGDCPQEVLDGIQQEQNHRYLLCEPDLPWEPDPLRENPTDRQRIFEMHLAEIKRLNRPYEIIRGIGDQRLRNAEAAVKKLVDPA